MRRRADLIGCNLFDPSPDDPDDPDVDRVVNLGALAVGGYASGAAAKTGVTHGKKRSRDRQRTQHRAWLRPSLLSKGRGARDHVL
jgi:hypothetical protein